MTIRKSLACLLSIVMAAGLFSCTESEQRINKESENINVNVFKETDIINRVDKNITFSDYQGGPTHTQKFSLYLYQETANFSDIYQKPHVNKLVFDNINEYSDFRLVGIRNQFMYFHIVENNKKQSIVRYNMDNGTNETIFTYDGIYQMAFAAVNENHLIWQEDENANWMKVSLNCYNINTGENTKFFSYSRDPSSGLMYSWNFNNIILDEDYVYFDNVENNNGGIASISLYRYDIKKNNISLVDEKRATEPLKYKGLSWLSFDDNNKEYILKNNSSPHTISLGKNYSKLFASDNIIVGHTNSERNGIMYYNGQASIPIIESTNNIDRIYCTDKFITWDGWSNDIPIFYDINLKKIIYADFLESGVRYAGLASENYLVFEAHEYISDPLTAEDAITTKSLIYYFISTDDLIRT